MSEPKTTWRVEWLDVQGNWRELMPHDNYELIRSQIDDFPCQQIYRVIRIETTETVEEER